MTRPPWKATHRIIVTFRSGKTSECLVQCTPSGAQEFRPAFTAEEWAANLTARWGCDRSGHWTWRGMETPNGTDTAVTIESLEERVRTTQRIRLKEP